MTHTTFDNSIPTLTEIFTPPIEHNVKTTEVDTFSSTASVHSSPRSQDIALNSSAPIALSPEEWHRMEVEIREHIARQLFSRIDFVLEQRVRDSLADVLQTVVEGLAAEIKHGLQQTMEEVIARAVSQELMHLQAIKK